MTETQQQALAAALVSLFGEGLEIELQRHAFGFLWRGASYGSLSWKAGD